LGGSFFFFFFLDFSVLYFLSIFVLYIRSTIVERSSAPFFDYRESVQSAVIVKTGSKEVFKGLRF